MRLICGVDEAGRGALVAGVYAAAVILDPKQPIAGLADSKKLTARKRADLETRIQQHAYAYAVASASAVEIDQLNILQASLLAMQRAIRALPCVPDEMLVDGLYLPNVDLPGRAIVQGDSLEPAISAASILAKTARDRAMMGLHAHYPQYGFDRHKGYPTAAHLNALACYGVMSEYRLSYAPVKRILYINSGTLV